MQSGQILSREEAFNLFNQYTQQFKDSLPAVIKDDKLNKYGEYDVIAVPNDTAKTIARGYWNLITEVQKYRSEMDSMNKFSLYAKAASLGYYFYTTLQVLYAEAHKDFGCEWMITKKKFDPSRLNELPGKSNSIYVHVVIEGKEQLFYVNKVRNFFVELPIVNSVFEKNDLKLDTPRPLYKKHLIKIKAQADHEYEYDINEDIYTMMKAAVDFLKNIYYVDKKEYKVKVLSHVIQQMRDKLPIDMAVTFLKKNVTVPIELDKYLAVDNQSQDTEKYFAMDKDAEGNPIKVPHQSLNVDIFKTLSKLEIKVKNYEAKKNQLVDEKPVEKPAEVVIEKEKLVQEKPQEQVVEVPSIQPVSVSDSASEEGSDEELEAVFVDVEAFSLNNEVNQIKIKLNEYADTLKKAKYDQAVFNKLNINNSEMLEKIQQLIQKINFEAEIEFNELVKKKDNAEERLTNLTKKINANQVKLNNLTILISPVELRLYKLSRLLTQYQAIISAHDWDLFFNKEQNILEHLNKDLPISGLVAVLKDIPERAWTTHFRADFEKQVNQMIIELEGEVSDLQMAMEKREDKQVKLKKEQAILSTELSSIKALIDANPGNVKNTLGGVFELLKQCLLIKDGLCVLENNYINSIDVPRKEQVEQWKRELDNYLEERNKSYKTFDSIKRVTSNTISVVGMGMFTFDPGYRKRRDYIDELKVVLDNYSQVDSKETRDALISKLNEGMDSQYKPRAKKDPESKQVSLQDCLSAMLAVLQPVVVEVKKPLAANL